MEVPELFAEVVVAMMPVRGPTRQPLDPLGVGSSVGNLGTCNL